MNGNTNVFKSARAQLVVDISKNIIKQYIEQLKKAIKENENDKYVKEHKYSYENKVERAKIALEAVEKLYENYDASLVREKFMMMSREDAKEEELEFARATNFSHRMFKEICISEIALLKPLYHCILKQTNNDFFKEIYGSDVSKYYNDNGIYDCGELNINNILGTKVTMDSGVFLVEDDRKAYPYDQGKTFEINANEIDSIIRNYIKKNYDENDFTMEDYRGIIRDVRQVSGTGAATSYEFDKGDSFSSYSFDFFDHYIKHKDAFINLCGENFSFENIVGHEPTLDDKLNEIKEKVAKFEALNKEEAELKQRLDALAKEKQQVKDEINGFKL